MKHEQLTHKIIASAYKVFNTLGYGFLETVYHKALLIELPKACISVESEKPLKVYYRNKVVGDFYVDLLVEDEIIIELKAVERLVKAHEVQLVNYLTALRKDIGLLINFSPGGVQVKRKYRKRFGQDLQDQQDKKI
jgi:GxxExxY protein